MSAQRPLASKPHDLADKRNAKRNKEHMADAFCWLLSHDSIFATIKPQGNTGWLPKCLVFLAILRAWSESRQLTDA
jgi:hypothetical protein